MAVNDLNAAAPSSVVVAFLRADNGILSAQRYAVTISLASLALTQYGNAQGNGTSKVFRSSAAAAFTIHSYPDNLASLTAAATQIATDYYLSLLGRADLALLGAQPWQPEGVTDLVEWEHGPGVEGIVTRARRAPWLAHAENLSHFGPSTECDWPTVAIPALICPIKDGNGFVIDIATEYQNWLLGPCPVPVGDPYCVVSPVCCQGSVPSGGCSNIIAQSDSGVLTYGCPAEFLPLAWYVHFSAPNCSVFNGACGFILWSNASCEWDGLIGESPYWMTANLRPNLDGTFTLTLSAAGASVVLVGVATANCTFPSIAFSLTGDTSLQPNCDGPFTASVNEIPCSTSGQSGVACCPDPPSQVCVTLEQDLSDPCSLPCLAGSYTLTYQGLINGQFPLWTNTDNGVSVCDSSHTLHLELVCDGVGYLLSVYVDRSLYAAQNLGIGSWPMADVTCSPFSSNTQATVTFLPAAPVATGSLLASFVAGPCNQGSGSTGSGSGITSDCCAGACGDPGVPATLTGTVTGQTGCYSTLPGTITFACVNAATPGNHYYQMIGTFSWCSEVGQTLTIGCVSGHPWLLAPDTDVLADPGYTCNPYNAIFHVSEGGNAFDITVTG